MSYGLIESGQGRGVMGGITIIDSGTIRKDEKDYLSLIERIKNKILRRK